MNNDQVELGVRLVLRLRSCAETVHDQRLDRATSLLERIRLILGRMERMESGPMTKVGTYFADALERLIYPQYAPHNISYSSTNIFPDNHFFLACPYVNLAQFAVTDAITEAFSGSSCIHLIDFGLNHQMLMQSLMMTLCLRPGGPPRIKLTGISLPQLGNANVLETVCQGIAGLANEYGITFEFQAVVANNLADIQPGRLGLLPSEVEPVEVNSFFKLHRLFSRSVLVDRVLALINALRPRIVTLVEQEANHNRPMFMERFNEALDHYTTMFDSLESSRIRPDISNHDVAISEAYLGREICNVVAYEGGERVERHEMLSDCRRRMHSAWFIPVHLRPTVFENAYRLLLDMHIGENRHVVEENEGCLVLRWKSRPLIATSAWRLA